jgi:hypothetical protein
MFKNLNSLIIMTSGIAIMLLTGGVIIPASASISSGPQTFPSGQNKKLSAQWWQWVLPIPPAINPLFDDNPCNVRQSGPFFFLAGTTGGEKVERTCTIPEGKSIFFPVVNFFQTVDKAIPAKPPNNTPFNTVGEVRKLVTENIDQAHNLHASVDGVNINLDNARAQSPPFLFTLGDDNIFKAPAGTYRALSDGYWVALKPLSVGEHEISFSGEGVDPLGNPFSVDVTYHITVK